jgi:DUF1680 family protein
MYIGSTIKVEKVAGTDIEMIQKTDYPWSGKVTLIVNPGRATKLTVYVRVPDRATSGLYTTVPSVKGLKSLSVNGKPVLQKLVNGYAEINRTWKAGDRIDLELPMEIQTLTADERIAADRGRVALRYGPLIYNVEKADQPDIEKYIGAGPLSLEWKKDLLGGVMVINGTWADGSPLIAIPNYTRNNRNTVKSTDKPERPDPADGSNVWIKKQL